MVQKPYWIVRHDPDAKHAGRWEAIRFPAVDNVTWIFDPLPKKVTWKGREVSILTCVGGPDDDDHYDGIPWFYSNMQPDRILLWTRRSWGSVAMLWERNPLTTARMQPKPLASCRFPPKWRHITGVVFDYSNYNSTAIWNPAQAIVRLVTEQAVNWVTESCPVGRDPIELGVEMFSDVARIAAWVLKMLERGQADMWNGLVEHSPQFLKDAWTALYPKHQRSARPTPLAFWVEDRYSSRLRVVSPESWRTIKPKEVGDWEAFKGMMPDPGSAWTLVVDGDKQAVAKTLDKNPSSRHSGRASRHR